MEVEIGRGKKGRRAYGFDDIAIVPSRRTRDAEDVDITWKLGAHTLPLPCLASAMDGVVDPAFAVTMGKLGGLAVLNLEGVQTRYENADEQLDRIASLPNDTATRTMQEIYKEPIKAELVAQAHQGDQGRRRAGRRVAHAAARRGVLPDRARRRPRRARHPGHRGLGRARQHQGRRRSTSRSSSPSARCR